MKYDLPSEAATSLTIINTALCSLTGWELAIAKTSANDPDYGGEWVYILRNHEVNEVRIVGSVVGGVEYFQRSNKETIMTATTARGVKCGNCRAYHGSADDVRFCYQTTMQPTTPGTVATARTTVDTDATADDVNQAALRIFGGPAPVERPASWKTLPDVPAGLYAIPSLSGNNDLDFYKIERPSEGKWAGYTFVKMVVGGHPEYSVKSLGKVQTIMNRIVEAGVRESAELYGREIGQCCKCNRTLTDDDSRRRGIGPECLKNSGW